MHARFTKPVAVPLAVVTGAIGSLACGGGTPAENESKSPSAVSAASITPGDRGNANTSRNGSVMTTLGDFLVDARSDTPIEHVFQEAQPGFPERLFLRHFVETEAGQKVFFEYDYSSSTRSFRISDEPGFITITKDREELVGKVGTVTIEPVGTSSVKVSFDELGVAPATAPLEAPVTDFIGSGVVEGPTRRVCVRASEVLGAENVPRPPAMPAHDEAWIAQFCGS